MGAFVEVPSERYDEMLGAVPPAYWIADGFLVGEARTHRRCRVSGAVQPAFAAFVRYRGSYWESQEAMTVAEFAAFDRATIP